MTQPPYGPQHPSSPFPGRPGSGPGYGPGFGQGGGYGRSYDPSEEPSYGPGPAYGSPLPPVPAGPQPGRRKRRAILIGAAGAGALLLGGAGYAVAAYLSGGGAQPEEALPADTVAFVKVDLDPAMGQKAAVASLMEKFPALGEGTEDVRQNAVDALLEMSGTRLDYGTDVEPWLGDRMAAALVRDDAADQGMAPVLVLAVDDQQAMADTLREVREDLGFGYAVRDDFLLITSDQATADRMAAEESSLSEDDDYAGDLAALEGDQLAVAWADLSAVQQVVGQAFGDAAPGLGDELAGRIVYGLHAEDDALELVGLDFSVSDAGPGPRPTEPTELVRALPEDTLAALSVSRAGDALVDRWADVEGTGMLDGFEEMFPDLELPDDVRTVLGSDLLVGVFGDLENPQFGVRAVTDDPERGSAILEGFNHAFDLGIPVVPAAVDDGYGLATDATAARALAGEDAGLADSKAFRDAVPGADDATLVGWVDLAAVQQQVPDTGDVRAEDYEAVEALGFTSTPTDEGSRFVLRLTTR